MDVYSKIYLDVVRDIESLERKGEDGRAKQIYARLQSAFLSSSEAYAIESSGFYAPYSVLNARLSRQLAEIIITERGEIDSSALDSCIFWCTQRSYSLSVGGEEESVRVRYVLRQLEFLRDSAEAKAIIKRIARPHSNRMAEQAIRDTLQISSEIPITDIDAKRAVIASLLMMLRQSLGSCFATAPAILLQGEEPLILMKDLEEIIATGQLKKTVRGVEYRVPMSRTWGQGDWKKPLLLSLPLDASQDKIWRSPIILRALNEAGLDWTEKKIFLVVEKIVSSLVQNKEGTCSLTAEQLVTVVLMNHYGIHQEDIQRIKQQGKTQMPLAQAMPGGNAHPQGERLPVEGSTHRKIKERLRERAVQDKKAVACLAAIQSISRTARMEAEIALLKIWEFTMASFSEVQFDLCRWNFYSSLGINWNDEGGIGQVLYTIAKEYVEETNRDLEEAKAKFDAINIEISYLEQRVRQASSEHEVNWIKMEYQSRKTEQYHIQQLCDMARERATKIAHVHQFLIDQYDRLLKEYFQEVYDADLHDVEVGMFDDAPAGFRLIYKHGRSNPSLWTSITSLDEYIDALASFFTLTEQELSSLPEIQGIEREFSGIITRLVAHIRSPLFQETALNRTLTAHGLRPVSDALSRVDSLEKKPWVFTSGGSMSSLISSYFRLEGDLDETSRWVENETELFAFLIDAVRLANNQIASFSPRSGSVQKPILSLLMHSPTHAFRLLPHEKPFQDSWASDTYSYSWIANRLRDPWLAMLKETLLTPEVISRALDDIIQLFPSSLHMRAHDAFHHAVSPFMRIFDFVSALRDATQRDHILRSYEPELFSSGRVEELVYSNFPYTSKESAAKTLREWVSLLVERDSQLQNRVSATQELIDKRLLNQGAVSAQELRQLCYAVSASLRGAIYMAKDGMFEAIQFLRSRKAHLPEPVIVADSNWLKEYFAFVVSPASLEVEFWVVSHLGTWGRPIPHWKRWLNGGDTSRTWGVFLNPMQYRIS